MAIATVALRNTLATAYATALVQAALYTTVPSGGVAGTEVTGGSPAYARVTLAWGAATASTVTGTATLNVPSGTTVAGAGGHAASGGAFQDGGAVSSQAFASQGTYALTIVYTQT